MKKEKLNGAIEFDPISDEVLETLFQDRLRCEKLITSAFMHELYTPAVIIHGLAELLLRKPDQIDPSQLREISREAEQLLQSLVLLTAVADESSVIQNHSLKDVVVQSTRFFEKSCLENGISIRIEVAEALRVDASAARLKSTLMLLLENAVEALESKSARDLKSIIIQAQKKSNEIHLMISDTGTGMTLDKPSLGLSLAQKLTRDMNIKMSFFSQKSQGNCFTLIFTQ